MCWHGPLATTLQFYRNKKRKAMPKQQIKKKKRLKHGHKLNAGL